MFDWKDNEAVVKIASELIEQMLVHRVVCTDPTHILYCDVLDMCRKGANVFKAQQLIRLPGMSKEECITVWHSPKRDGNLLEYASSAPPILLYPEQYKIFDTEEEAKSYAERLKLASPLT